jgi:uncharacterized protein
MRAKLIHESHGQRTFAVVLDKGDEVMTSLMRFADHETVTAAQVTAIGAFEKAVLGFFTWDRKEYERIPVGEQVEVLSLLGDIGVEESGKPALHLHAVLGRRDGSTVGGHLLEAHVRPTLEVVVTESPAHLRRRKDPETGITLIRL